MDEETRKVVLLAMVAAVGAFIVTGISLYIQKMSLEKKYGIRKQ